jgi:hypothetical protein
MITNINGLRGTVKRGTRVVLLGCFAAALAACATSTAPLPTVASTQMARTAPLRTAMLPNGLVAEPYAD